MSTDWDDPDADRFAQFLPKEPEKQSTRNYPICPRCGCNTIVMYSPPREGIVGTEEGYRLYHEKNWAAYVDWNRAHLYCCNGDTNCDVTMPIIGGLMTPVNEKRYRVTFDGPRGQSASEPPPSGEAVTNNSEPSP